MSDVDWVAATEMPPESESESSSQEATPKKTGYMAALHMAELSEDLRPVSDEPHPRGSGAEKHCACSGFGFDGSAPAMRNV